MCKKEHLTFGGGTCAPHAPLQVRHWIGYSVSWHFSWFSKMTGSTNRIWSAIDICYSSRRATRGKGGWVGLPCSFLKIEYPSLYPSSHSQSSPLLDIQGVAFCENSSWLKIDMFDRVPNTPVIFNHLKWFYTL